MRRQVTLAALLYLANLLLILAIGQPDQWTVLDVFFIYPLVGMLVMIVLVAAVFEVFAIDLPFVLDTLRHFARKLLPQPWSDRVVRKITALWGLMPQWMQDGSPWMPDEERDAKFK